MVGSNEGQKHLTSLEAQMLLETCCFSKAVKGPFERRDGRTTRCPGPLQSSDLQAGVF